jgi:hypothetical protein
MIKSILMSFLLLFKIVPSSAVTSLSLQVEMDGIVVSDEEIDICRSSQRSIKFIIKTDAKKDDINLGLFDSIDDDKTNYFIKGDNELSREAMGDDIIILTKFQDDFEAKTYFLKVFLDGKWEFLGRKLKIQDCRVPIEGGLYQDSEFKDLYPSEYTLKFGDREMTVKDGKYESKDNDLYLYKSYRPDFGGIPLLNDLVNERESFTVSSRDKIVRNYWVDPWKFTSDPKMRFECGRDDEKLYMIIDYIASGLVKINKIKIMTGDTEAYYKEFPEGYSFNFDWPITEKSMEGKEVILTLESDFGSKDFNLGTIQYWSCQYMWFQVENGGILSNKAISNKVKKEKSMANSSLVSAPIISVGDGQIGPNSVTGERVVSLKDFNKMIDSSFAGFDVTLDGERVIDNNIPASSIVNVIVAPSIRITKDVKEINGILISYGGDIIIDTDIDKTQKDSQLIVNGSLVSKGDIVIKRDMANSDGMNNNEPVLKVNFKPEYLFKLPNALIEILGEWSLGG